MHPAARRVTLHAVPSAAWRPAFSHWNCWLGERIHLRGGAVLVAAAHVHLCCTVPSAGPAVQVAVLGERALGAHVAVFWPLDEDWYTCAAPTPGV